MILDEEVSNAILEHLVNFSYKNEIIDLRVK